MKILSKNEQPVCIQKSLKKIFRRPQFRFYLALFAISLVMSCNKYDANAPTNDSRLANKSAAAPESEVRNMYRGMNPQTLWELQQARGATAKYRNISKAFDDGYADINVVVPNMGYHFMKADLVDPVFDVRHPEILVYNKNLDG